MKDVEAARSELQTGIAAIAQKYGLDEAELAWILLAEGTFHYFRDVCRRQPEVGATQGTASSREC